MSARARCTILAFALLSGGLLRAGPPPAPRLLSPPDGMEMTDAASYFQWAPISGCTNFEIQVARDQAFADIVRTKRTVNGGYHRNLYFPKDVLPAGAFTWRVRAIAGGGTSAWSEVRSVIVNTDHPVRPEVVRKIGPESPVFLMRSRSWDPIQDASHVKDIIPAGLERVIVVDDIALAGEKVFERARKWQELGLDFVLWNNRCQVPLATMEFLFQTFSHCIGTAEGEHFDGITWEKGPEGNLAEADYVHRAWVLCGKYGRFYFIGDGDAGSYRWPGFADRERERFARYRRHIVPMFKTTKGDLALHSYGAVEGLLVADWVENTGTWADEWIWPESGFTKLGQVIPESERWANRRKVGTRECPWTYDLQMWLVGIASGATVFHLESAHQWGPDGRAAQHYTRSFLPFVQAVVERKLIPSRAAFLDSVKLAVNPDLALLAGRHGKQYSGGYAFLRDLYGVQADGDQELIPNNSRHGIVCLLPPGTTNLAGRTRIVEQGALSDPARAVALFNAANPQRFTGDAFMWECDGTVIVTSAHENQVAPQTFALPFNHVLLRGLAGSIGVHEYLIGKLTADGFWFQTNGEYPGREIGMSLACARKPDVHIKPPAAATLNEWDEATKTLRLCLARTAVPVEVELK
jgi:hypothetical protein